jgi:hypothetical protein
MRLAALLLAALLLALAAAVPACSDAPPGWPGLLAAKIREQYPSYDVVPEAGGQLRVVRPGLPPATVDAEAIGRFCQRGPRDCGYATDQMLQGLRGP